MFPERLGTFEIAGLLGEGGSALVYAARDGTREVALKVLHPDAVLDERQVERFLEEAERMRRVSHPALITVLGAGTLPGGSPFIAMPRLRGRTLAERLGDGPLAPERALSLFDDIAGAVITLHDAGLVHRDIKPENVFWCEPEQRLVLLDLGIAREWAASPSTTTKAGFLRGTPAYMAPERLLGQPATVRSDVYELGLLLFLMLTARLPWEEGDPAGRIQPNLRAEDRALMPPGLAALLLEVLSFDPSKRPVSVVALRDAVRTIARSGVPNITPPYAVDPRAVVPARSGPPPAYFQGVDTPHLDSPRVVVDTDSVRRSFRPSASTTQNAAYSFAPTQLQKTPVAGATQRSVAEPPIEVRTAPQPNEVAAALSRRGKKRSVAGTAITFFLGVSVAGVVAYFATERARDTSAARTPETATATSTSEVTVAPTAPTPTSTSTSMENVVTAVAPSASSVTTASASAVASASGSASGKTAPVKEGVLPREAVEGPLKSRVNAMMACAKSEAERPDFTEMKVTLNFWIQLDGTVGSASATGNAPSTVKQCILGQVRAIRFKQPEGGPVNVIFPLRITK